MGSTGLEAAFYCFGSESSDGEDSGGTIEQCDQQRRHQLLNKAQLRQVDSDSASEAHRNRRPIASPDFEVFATLIAGKGLRALRTFGIGDEILREHAVMRVPNQQAAATRQAAEILHAKAVQQSFQRLSLETQQCVLDLSNSQNRQEEKNQTKESTVLGVYHTNSFLLGGRRNITKKSKYDEDYGGLFLTIARINHACCPNANHMWRPDLQQSLVFATRDIQVGEEIHTTYGPSDEALDTTGRRLYLNERFNFECCCSMCVEGNDLGADDRMRELNSRRHEISFLLAATAANATTDAVVGNNKNAEDILESTERCLELLRAQGYGDASGAFIKSILHQGYQAALLLEREPRGNMTIESERLARSYLLRELLATENGEGVGSPNALLIRDMLDGIPAR